MKILIAEDDLTSRMVLESALRKWDYEVISTSRGDEALEVLKAEGRPGLALLDWMMPGLSGVEVCREIRRLDTPNPVYVILLTAMGRKEDVVAGLQSGADDYVTKPFDRDELRARINVGRRVVDLRETLATQVRELESALTQVRMLQGIIPICAHCHMIRDDRESWRRLEEYLESHSDAQFSHGICPECLDKYYPEPKDD